MEGSKIRLQDMVSAITFVSINPSGRLLAWEFYKENFGKILKRYVEVTIFLLMSQLPHISIGLDFFTKVSDATILTIWGNYILKSYVR